MLSCTAYNAEVYPLYKLQCCTVLQVTSYNAESFWCAFEIVFHPLLLIRALVLHL